MPRRLPGRTGNQFSEILIFEATGNDEIPTSRRQYIVLGLHQYVLGVVGRRRALERQEVTSAASHLLLVQLAAAGSSIG